MAADARELPPELRAFIHSCIDSIVQVELLLLLRSAGGVRTVREAAARLGVPPAVARRDLDTLAARGLLEVRVGEETAYGYGPKSDDLRRYAELLAEHCGTSRQAVFGFIAAESRLSIKRFADAFKLRDPEN